MAITITDIQEKAFSTQLNNGYNRDEVDDYLDEIVETFRTMIGENLALRKRITELECDLTAKDEQIREIANKVPDYNEEGYFKDLQSAMRETLLASRRIADETENSAKTEAEKTVSDARAEAERIVTEASTKAESITSEALAASESAKAEVESLKSAAQEYRAGFRKLVESQLEVLKANDLLFK